MLKEYVKKDEKRKQEHWVYKSLHGELLGRGMRRDYGKRNTTQMGIANIKSLKC